MATPVDVVNVMWLTLPFVLISLLVSLRALMLNFSRHRSILAASCVLAILANVGVILLVGTWQGINYSVTYQVGVISYNLSLWTARLYVCNRMAKLSPSPAISAAFDRLAYVTGTLFTMTMVPYCVSAYVFYQTHPGEVPAITNETAAGCFLAANFIFEVASIYLHVKSLRTFGTSNSTGMKLLILSCSTLTSIVFGVVQSAAQLLGDVMTELMMAGIVVALLPTSIILGEAIVKLIGKHTGKKLINSERTSQGTAISSKEKRNTFVKSMTSQPTTIKPVAATASVDEPTRQPPTLPIEKTKPVVATASKDNDEPIRQ